MAKEPLCVVLHNLYRPAAYSGDIDSPGEGLVNFVVALCRKVSVYPVPGISGGGDGDGCASCAGADEFKSFMCGNSDLARDNIGRDSGVGGRGIVRNDVCRSPTQSRCEQHGEYHEQREK